jgi:hypothetical protein
MWIQIIKDSFTNKTISFVFLSILFLWKLFYSLGLELIPDEAYYWEWSRHLDLSFYDQGPGVAYYIRFFTLFLGDTLFSLKLAAGLASLFTAYFVYLTAHRLGLNGLQLFWLLILSQFNPGFLGGSFLIMHDSPLMLSWAIGIYLSVSFILTNKPWYLYGMFFALGTGALSKHSMIFFVMGILLWLIFYPSERKIFKSLHLYFGIILTGIMISGVLWWNYKTGWHNIDAIMNLRSAGGQHTVNSTGKLFFGQLLSFSPLWFIGICISMYIWLKKNIPFLKYIGLQDKFIELPLKPELAFLFWNAAAMPIFFFIMSFRKDIQANWLYPAYLPATILLAHLIQEKPIQKIDIWILRLVQIGFFFALPLGIYTLYSAKITEIFHLKMEPHFIPEYKAKGFTQIAKEVQELKTQIDPDGIIVANRYQDAAILSWNLPSQPFITSINIMQKNQYNLWPSMQKGKNYFLVHIQENTCEKSFIFFQPYLERMFDSVQEFPEKDIILSGNVLKRYQVWYLKNYRQEWHLDIIEFLEEGYLNSLLPNLTINKEFKGEKALFEKGINLLNSYYQRPGETNCKIFQ